MRRLLLVQCGSPSRALLRLLGSAGHRVVVAGDAEAALEIAQRVPLRTIVANFRLGIRSGVWLCEQVRDLQPKAQRILVVNDDHIDATRLIDRGIIHKALRSLGTPSRVVERIAGIPEMIAEEPTPIVSVPCW